MSFPLQIAKICLDCEHVFAAGGDFCVACGSIYWVWLSHYYKPLKEAVERVAKDGGDIHEKVICIATINSTFDRS